MIDSDSPNVKKNFAHRMLGMLNNMIESNHEKDIKYWSGRLGRTFSDYDEMCGARDHYIMEQKMLIKKLEPPQDTKQEQVTGPWNLMNVPKFQKE